MLDPYLGNDARGSLRLHLDLIRAATVYIVYISKIYVQCREY